MNIAGTRRQHAHTVRTQQRQPNFKAAVFGTPDTWSQVDHLLLHKVFPSMEFGPTYDIINPILESYGGDDVFHLLYFDTDHEMWVKSIHMPIESKDLETPRPFIRRIVPDGFLHSPKSVQAAYYELKAHLEPKGHKFEPLRQDLVDIAEKTRGAYEEMVSKVALLKKW